MRLLFTLLILLSSCTPKILATSQHGTVIQRDELTILVSFPVVVGPYGSNFFNHFYDPTGKYQVGDIWP